MKDRVWSAQKQELIDNANWVQPRTFGMVERLECGHEPHLAKTEELLQIIERAARAEPGDLGN